MPRQNSQADLVDFLGDYETRLRKAERQLSVARTARSSVATKQTTISTSPVPLATADQVTVVLTSACLVRFYVRATLEGSGAGVTSYVYVYDETTTTSYQILETTGTSSDTRVSVPGSTGGAKAGTTLGGQVALFLTTAGPRSFSLRYAVNSGTGSFSNRLLIATAEPF